MTNKNAERQYSFGANFEEKKFSKCNLLRQSKKISIIIRNETTKRNFLNLGKNQ